MAFIFNCVVLVRLIFLEYCIAMISGPLDACSVKHINISYTPMNITCNTTEKTNEYFTISASMIEGETTFLELSYAQQTDLFSYMYVEHLDESGMECSNKYVLITLDSQSCAVYSSSKKYAMHFKNIHSFSASISGINTSTANCHKVYSYRPSSTGNKLQRCNTTEYDMVKAVIIGTKWYELPYFDVNCPADCVCTLSYKQWAIVCKNTQDLFVLLVHDPNIIKLTFSNTNLSHITPNAFFGCDKLQYLSLESNQLKSLPVGALHGLVKLQVLNLINNHIVLRLSGVFEGLRELTTLNLANNQMTQISAGVFIGLSALRWLNLHNNQLTSFQIGVFEGLVQLRSLQLDYNNVTTLQMGVFSKLLELTQINLEGNQLTSLSPGVFLHLMKLKKCDLQKNSLTSLSIGVLNEMIDLTVLNLHSNQLTSLGIEVFKGLTSMTRIDIHDNHLTSLPTGLFIGMMKLQEIYLYRNKLRFLHVGVFSDNKKLAWLDLSNNHLSTLPNGIFNRSGQLKELYIQDNNISFLPIGVFSELNNLEWLELSNNQLVYMPTGIDTETFQSLIYLNIANNKLLTWPRLGNLAKLQILDLSKNNLELLHENAFTSMTSLVSLDLGHNAITELPLDIFEGLAFLLIVNLSRNMLTDIKHGVFRNQQSLHTLKLSDNKLINIRMGLFSNMTRLQNLDIQQNNLFTLSTGMFDDLKSLEFVNISHNSIQKVGGNIFLRTSVKMLDLRWNALFLVTKSSFTGLQNSTLLVDRDATCCFAENSNCISTQPRPVYLTCKRMLENISLKVSMWILGIFAILFNALVFYLRCTDKKSNKVQNCLISQLSLSDFLMGVNMILLAGADAYYANFFPSYTDIWRKGVACKLAGVLSILSSEVSVFLITLISFDRFQGVRYPFSNNRLTTKSAQVWVSIIWFVGLLLSVVPVILSGMYTDIFEVSEVCVGIPMVRRPIAIHNISSIAIQRNDVKLNTLIYTDLSTYEYYKIIDTESVQTIISTTYTTPEVIGHQLATYFSIILFIGVNLFCFIFVAILYTQIFVTAKETAKRAGRNQAEKDEIRMAMKMSAVVMTDFLCWVPLIIVCILAQCKVITVHPTVYAWTVAFIVPINSAINPFLYTLMQAVIDHQDKKRKQTIQQFNKIVKTSTNHFLKYQD